MYVTAVCRTFVPPKYKPHHHIHHRSWLVLCTHEGCRPRRLVHTTSTTFIICKYTHFFVWKSSSKILFPRSQQVHIILVWFTEYYIAWGYAGFLSWFTDDMHALLPAHPLVVLFLFQTHIAAFFFLLVEQRRYSMYYTCILLLPSRGDSLPFTWWPRGADH